jgi:hypothetical protein
MKDGKQRHFDAEEQGRDANFEIGVGDNLIRVNNLER